MYAQIKVLIVEDSNSLRAMLVRLLEFRGYSVTEADCSAAALACLANERFDLMLCDLHMPGIDGFTLLERVNRDTVQAPLPVIVLSGALDGESCRKLQAAGAAAWLGKPFKIAELLELVDRQLGVEAHISD